MTWGEIQIESLKKMFLNNDDLSIEKLEDYKENKKYKTYLFSMKQACNEAIRYISNLIPNIKSYELEVKKERYDLSEVIKDFNSMDSIITNKKWYMETDSILNIDKEAGTILVYYEATPLLIDNTTSNDTKLDINKDCVQYIPLYIAGELYKDDDLTLSTVYMNEFMNNINFIANRPKAPVNNKIMPIYTIE